MQGLLNGISSRVEDLRSVMGGVAGVVGGALSGAGNAIGGAAGAVGGALSGAASATPAEGEIANYISHAASMRGIDPSVALRVANAEGGVTEPARRGTFDTGSSWWPFQLHYGGVGTQYEHLGTVAGMGNEFTRQTGFQPGDPSAWQASVDYALDEVARSGWGKWYGAAAAGVSNWQGIRDDGGWLMPGISTVGNFTGAPERVLGPGSSSGNTVTFTGDIIVQTAPGTSEQQAEEVALYLADKLDLAFGNMRLP
jgi:hypothetical protein